jgi:transcriptional regulator with XRE-family HTH domain
VSARTSNENALGEFLRDRRSKLDPASFGVPLTRRRTPGLRREEVAQRANVSATWYTWLEQGRGGAPSSDVLDRIARALMLTSVEREHLFLLGRGHVPEATYQPNESVTPRLQRVLDALEYSPAVVKTAMWDVVAWNRAFAAVLTDYATVPAHERNVLRQMFVNSRVRAAQTDWEGVARFVVGAFRADVARAGATERSKALIDELSALSPDFVRLWRENDVRGSGEGTKKIRHEKAGIIAMEFSAFAIEGRPDLGMVVYTPATPADIAIVRSLIDKRHAERR